MSKVDKYRQYLKSGAWAENRALSMERTNGFCQFCGEPAINVHHVSYPKQFGREHPHSLIPVCKRCHDISHGVQQLKTLSDAQQMTEITPNGSKLRYLITGARVYASAQSWERALQVPASLSAWFLNGLPRTALLRKNFSGGELEMMYLNVAVYRWHAVAELLRAFDRNWYQHEYRSRPSSEQAGIKKFHENYENLVAWGYELQERALSSALVTATPPSAPVTQEVLLDAIKQAVAPRLHVHDERIHEHDLIISEIKEAVPTLRDDGEFIPVRQAIHEQGLDPTLMPLYPKSRENLSGLAGQLLKKKGCEQGQQVVARLDGQAIEVAMNTYRRRDIYASLKEILTKNQMAFFELDGQHCKFLLPYE